LKITCPAQAAAASGLIALAPVGKGALMGSIVVAPLANRTLCNAGRAAAGIANVAATKLTAFSAHCVQKSIVVPARRMAPLALGAGMMDLHELHCVWVIWMFIFFPFQFLMGGAASNMPSIYSASLKFLSSSLPLNACAEK
jgi:hypothetical protein